MAATGRAELFSKPAAQRIGMKPEPENEPDSLRWSR
jgi:hypothetical protein